MNVMLKVEEAFLFLLGILIFPYLDLSWWWFVGFILVPDVSMVGYLINNKYGAFCYNLFHHRAVALIVAVTGFALHNTAIEFAGVILFTHIAMDRMMGYGLKYEKGFRYTHLGEIGKPEPVQ